MFRKGAKENSYHHDLQRGDHVIRWEKILIYPIQVHGIVVSAGEDIVTIVDFGLTASKSYTKDSDMYSEDGCGESTTCHGSEETEANTNSEDMANHEDRALMKACESHRKDLVGADRVNILTLTEEDEIKRWKKVNYGEVLKKQWDWKFWRKDERNGQDKSEEEMEEGEEIQGTIIRKVNEEPKENNKEYAKSDNETEESQKKNTTGKLPHLPKSDPTNIVVARVRYLLTHPQVLPAHHILFSNSECIAVWCKTGRWSTLQASIALYSTAAGNLKTTILTSTGVAASTVTVSVPASGVAGWFGMTTTATVGLASVQPWLIPAIAGYGLIAVGTPMLLIYQAKGRWESTTNQLNDGFWGSVDSDVYIEAIKSWSGLE